MNALILSHQSQLQQQLLSTLTPLSEGARVQRSVHRPQPSDVHLLAEGRPDLVFVDLAWCGLGQAGDLLDTLRGQLASTPLVLLVDRPEEVTLAREACAQADLYVGKSASPKVVRESLRRWFAHRPAADIG